MTPGKHSRLEDQRFITGQGHYTSDHNLPQQTYAYFLRSDRPHAEIRSINAKAALARPGVLAVLTGDDAIAAGFKPMPIFLMVKGRGGAELIKPPRPALAVGKVRFVGDQVALIIAESPSAAQDAAEYVEIDYQDLPPVTTPVAAIKPGAAQIWDIAPNNLLFDYEMGDAEKVDAAFKSAAKVARINLHNTRVVANPMEPRACIATFDNAQDKYTLYSVTQGIGGLRMQLSAAMGVPEEKIDVVAWDVGGGFGVRFNAYPEYTALLLAAKKLGRPVKWVATRTETLIADENSRGVDSTSEVAFDANGKILATRFSFLCDIGAYCVPVGAFINTGGIFGQLTSVYDIPVSYARSRLAVTNTAPIGAYRGAGRPLMSYAMERVMDEGARITGIDRIEIRRRNLVATNKFPYKAYHGKVWDSGDFVGLLDHAVKASDWQGFAARKAESAKRGKLRGLGIACYIEETGGGFAPHDEVELRFGSNGELAMYAVSHNHGQGHETAFAEIIAKVMGIARESIVLKNGAPESPRLVGNATGGSRTLHGAGSVMFQGAKEIVEKGKELAAQELEVAAADIEFADGTYRIKGTDRKLTMRDLIDKHKGKANHPLNVRTKLSIGSTYPNGCHIVEVEIEPATGVTEIVKYSATDDIGNIINHQLVEGQLHGGIVQGVGQIFGEHAQYDAESGQPLTGTFMDYYMPRSSVLKGMQLFDHPVPTKSNPLGAKGAGEAGNTGSLPALMGAIVDALRSAGVEHFEMPATPARVWGALQAAKAGKPAAFAPAQA
jgi:aerobic carbon-monoxide dehydrogenase large subunit